MTPLWRKTFLAISDKRAYGHRYLPVMQSAWHSFDMSMCKLLTADMSFEIDADLARGPVDLGERVIMPCDDFFLDFGELGYLISRTATDCDMEIRNIKAGTVHSGNSYDFYFVDDTRPEALVKLGFIYRTLDGRFGAIHHKKPTDDDFSFFAIALCAIAIIGSPSAYREDVAPHRGFARNYRRSTPGAPVPKATKIYLGKRRSGAGIHACTEGERSRALHFCRAHKRRIGDRLVDIRAHWRGDASFGIRLGSYRGPLPDSLEAHSEAKGRPDGP